MNNAEVPAGDFAPREDGRYLAVKALVVVDAGATVTLSVPESEQKRVSLLYDTAFSDDGLYQVADGTFSATFRACPDRETQFNGGFVVAGAQCARVQIRPAGGDAAFERALPFGKKCFGAGR